MSKTVALIPARGGSKGLPGKNIKLLLGKPLIHYTIEAALNCPLIDAVYVSTDDDLIASVSEELPGVTVIKRPPELATDTASSLDVARHFLNWHQEQFAQWPETFLLLQPTSPLRTAEHLIEALSSYQALLKPASLVSVSQGKPVSWQGFVDEDGQFCFHQTTDLTQNRQAVPNNFGLNGAIYCTSPERVYHGDFLQNPVYPYEMSPETSVDIDTLQDFLWVEFLLTHHTPAFKPELTRGK